MKKEKKKPEIKAKIKREKKDIVVFDNENTPKDYNFRVVEEYVKPQKISPVVIGREIGELIGFIKSRSVDGIEAEAVLGILNRLLDIYIESGTFNGVTKKIPFKFKKISDTERKAIIKAFKEKMNMGEAKPKPDKDNIPNYTG